MKHAYSLIGTVAILLLALGSEAYALDKAHPDSRSGHGQGRDVWLIKNSEQVAQCGGPISTQTNPNTGAVSTSCRVNGMVREVVKAPKKGGAN